MTATPARGELSRILRQLLKATGKTKTEVAAATGFSLSKVSRTLGGQNVPTRETVVAVLAAMGQLDTDDGRRAVELVRSVREDTASRIVLMRDGAQRLQQRFNALERESRHVQTYTPVIVPGLLQTERYAQAIFASRSLDAAEQAGGVAGRLQRQQRLSDPAYRFTQITTEGALRWQVLAPDLMAEQLVHLARLARTVDPERVRIGVLPWTVAVDLFPMTSFDIYDERELLLGTDIGAAPIKASGDVAVYLDAFARLSRLAVFGEAAAGEFDRIAGEYRALQSGPDMG